jgi:hypothetical protein
MKKTLKGIGDTLRMILVYMLVDLIIKVAPDTPEGKLWILMIHAASKEEIRRMRAEMGEAR